MAHDAAFASPFGATDGGWPYTLGSYLSDIRFGCKPSEMLPENALRTSSQSLKLPIWGEDRIEVPRRRKHTVAQAALISRKCAYPDTPTITQCFDNAASIGFSSYAPCCRRLYFVAVVGNQVATQQ